MRTRIIFAFCYLFIASTSYTQSGIEVAGSIVLNDSQREMLYPELLEPNWAMSIRCIKD